MQSKYEDALQKLHALDREALRMRDVAALLGWDQEVNLPPAGIEERSEQLALIEGLAHDRATDPAIDKFLLALGSSSDNPSGDPSLPPLEGDFCKVMRRDYDREAKLPADFVRDMARAQGLSQAAWQDARKHNDFSAFAPHLQGMLDMMRKTAVFWGAPEHDGVAIYDALLDIYEPGVKAADIERLFDPLAARLPALIQKIGSRPGSETGSETSFPNALYDIEQQRRYSHELMKRLGWNMNYGRVDESAHPFTTGLGCSDVRITTHYYADKPLSSIFSVIHESGHAFYDLRASAAELGGSILGEGVSMGVHESQSRLWENVIGRSRAFWKGQLPRLKEFFPTQLKDVSLESFYKAVNTVRPSLIRIEADEVSYSLHIILRFELEKRLFSGELGVNDLPQAWNEAMQRYLGVKPTSDADGVLQDIHWSQGSFGYFPSYALGNLYGLQFWKALKAALPDVEEHIAAGNFAPLHDWLAEHIHAWGRRLDPPDLLKQATGEALSPEAFLDYVESKYGELDRI